jgi:hypothetical protein
MLIFLYPKGFNDPGMMIFGALDGGKSQRTAKVINDTTLNALLKFVKGMGEYS